MKNPYFKNDQYLRRGSLSNVNSIGDCDGATRVPVVVSGDSVLRHFYGFTEKLTAPITSLGGQLKNETYSGRRGTTKNNEKYWFYMMKSFYESLT